MRKVLKQMSLSLNTGVNQKKKVFCNPNQTGTEGAAEEWSNQDELLGLDPIEPDMSALAEATLEHEGQSAMGVETTAM